jgi:hypothetical protein
MSTAHRLSQFSGSHLEKVSARLAMSMSRLPVVARRSFASPDLEQARNVFLINVEDFMDHVAFTPSATWQGYFDCATWLRTPRGLTRPVQLLLRYVDSQGEKTLFVDRCGAGSCRTALLNGTILLRVCGKVREAAFFLMDDNAPGDVVPEDSHFQPQYSQVLPV